MPNWIRVATVEECPPGTAIERIADGRVVALYNVDGMLYALDGICPHQGGPLGEGELTGSVVTCPWHGWQFDVCTGQNELTSSSQQPQIPIRVEDGAILVDVEEPAEEGA